MKSVVFLCLRVPILQEDDLLGGGVQPEPALPVFTPPQLVFVVRIQEGVRGLQVLRLVELRLIVVLCNLGVICGISDSHTFPEGIGSAYIIAAGVSRLQPGRLRVPELTVTVQVLVPSIGDHSLLGFPLRFDSCVAIDICPKGFLHCLLWDDDCKG